MTPCACWRAVPTSATPAAAAASPASAIIAPARHSCRPSAAAGSARTPSATAVTPARNMICTIDRPGWNGTKVPVPGTVASPAGLTRPHAWCRCSASTPICGANTAPRLTSGAVNRPGRKAPIANPAAVNAPMAAAPTPGSHQIGQPPDRAAPGSLPSSRHEHHGHARPIKQRPPDGDRRPAGQLTGPPRLGSGRHQVSEVTAAITAGLPFRRRGRLSLPAQEPCPRHGGKTAGQLGAPCKPTPASSQNSFARRPVPPCPQSHAHRRHPRGTSTMAGPRGPALNLPSAGRSAARRSSAPVASSSRA